MGCIFCEIVRRESPSDIFYENERVIVFHDIRPQYPTHLLICPKEHYRDLLEAPPEAALDLHLAVQEVSRMVDTGNRGFKVQVNNGSAAGQIVFHLHYHFLSSKKIDRNPPK